MIKNDVNNVLDERSPQLGMNETRLHFLDETRIQKLGTLQSSISNLLYRSVRGNIHFLLPRELRS